MQVNDHMMIQARSTVRTDNLSTHGDQPLGPELAMQKPIAHTEQAPFSYPMCRLSGTRHLPRML